jgi:hypothetical protein
MSRPQVALHLAVQVADDLGSDKQPLNGEWGGGVKIIFLSRRALGTTFEYVFIEKSNFEKYLRNIENADIQTF